MYFDSEEFGIGGISAGDVVFCEFGSGIVLVFARVTPKVPDVRSLILSFLM